MINNSNFHFIVPVWGESYTRLFAEICLPMLITPGNLEAFSDDDTAVFVIVTTYNDYEILNCSDSYKKLEKLIRIRVYLMDGIIDFNNTHKAMTQCYQYAMNSTEVKKGETYFVFLTPDSFWSDGSFRFLFDRAKNGYWVVMVTGLRLCKEDITPVLRKRIVDLDESVAYKNRELVRMALDNLHQMSNAHNWLSRDAFLNQWPSNIYWKDGCKTMFAHCFHMHPLMVRSSKRKINIKLTIDGDMLHNLGYPRGKYYVVQDSDDVIGLELSDKDRSWGQELASPNIESTQRFAVKQCAKLNWYFFSHRIVYHSENGDGSSVVKELIERVVAEISRVKFTTKLKCKLEGAIIVRLLRRIKRVGFRIASKTVRVGKKVVRR